MKALKIVGRVILLLLMIPAVLQLVLAVIGIVAAATRKPEALSYMIGNFVGTLLLLMLFIWLFRKLGDNGSDRHRL